MHAYPASYFRRAGIMLVVLCISLAGSSQAIAATTDKNEEPGVQFLKRIKQMVDSNNLMDPEVVAKMLDTKFILEPKYDSPINKEECRDENGSNTKYHVYTAPNFWYHSTSSGKEGAAYSVKIDNATGGKDTVTVKESPAVFFYFLTLKTNCKTKSVEKDIRVDFENLASYSCIRADMLKDIFPNLVVPTKYQKEGGFEIYTYDNPTMKHVGTASGPGASVIFTNQPGLNCLQEAEIFQF